MTTMVEVVDSLAKGEEVPSSSTGILGGRGLPDLR